MTRASKQFAKQGVEDALEQGIESYSYSEDTPLSNLVYSGGRITQKSVNLVNDGATTENLFTVTGAVRVLELYGVATAVVDADTFSGVKFELDDGTAQSDITAAVDASSIVEGGLLLKQGNAAAALIFSNPTAGVVLNAASKWPMEPCILVQKTGGVTTYIRIAYTGDADTDYTLNFTCRWSPISSDGAIAAV